MNHRLMVAALALVTGSTLSVLGGCAPSMASGGTEAGLVSGASVGAPQVQAGGPPPRNNNWTAQTVMSGLDRPWGFVWLPDGRMLVTQKGGSVVLVQNFQSQGVIGVVPGVFSGGQGGLMDVSLHPDFARNNIVYFTASQGSNQVNMTTVVRARLQGDRLSNMETIFRVAQVKSGGQHFGSRIVWLRDKTMLVSIGDGGNPPASFQGQFIRNLAQDRGAHTGKVLRLDENGKAPRDNPFFGQPGAAPEVWSYGHRNIQGMAIDPSTQRVWANEHGARGGDELNEIKKGSNYGWPVVTHSIEYSGQTITNERSRAGMVDPLVVWTPCPAPSGLVFYTGNRYPNWRGDLFSGGLAGNDVRRIDLDANGRVVGQEQLNVGQRVRDVRQGPDGFMYVITDNGNMIRIVPGRA